MWDFGTNCCFGPQRDVSALILCIAVASYILKLDSSLYMSQLNMLNYRPSDFKQYKQKHSYIELN